jgi:demethylmenaquinone methyltransferase/2-methoxy-6-polyprenyl-1,4-benzoquinol methylase
VTEPRDDLDPLLAEQVAYYRALAGEYHEHSLPFAGGDEIAAALDAFRPTGEVLELACGPGTWTAQLLRHATTLTAVDSSPEMLALAAQRLGADKKRVRFIQADLFAWAPDRRYDVVFFGLWLSHVPLGRFDAFWHLVADCLKPAGRVFFADDGYRTPDELVEGEASSIIRRRLNDGTAYRAVKVPHRPKELQERLERMGWRITVTPTEGPFFWGAGTAPERLLLRDVTGSDLPVLYEQQRDPEAIRMAAVPPRDRTAFMARWRESILPDDTIVAKTVVVDGRVAGHIVCWEDEGKRLVGYWLGREFWGRGVATRALSQFLAQVPARPLHAHVAPHNRASIRVLEKCGFTISHEDDEDVVLELAA